MAIDPDKIELRPRAPEVKEIGRVSKLAEAAESLVNLLQKINDLGDAKKAILHARDLYGKGETGKAKELAVGIFQRLQQIGKAPEGLDVGAVQEKLRLGKYDELADSMKKAKDSGDAKGDKNADQLIEKIKTVKVDNPKEDKAIRDANQKANEAITTEIQTEVVARGASVDAEENSVQKEFTDLLNILEKKAGIADKVEIDEIKASIESRTIGEVDTKVQIDKLRKKISSKVEDKISGHALLGSTDKAKVAKGIAAGNLPGALGGLAERVKKSRVGEQAFITRLQKLTVGMDKVNESVEKGIGLQEAVRSLDVDEIREVRNLLSSLAEIKDVDDRSPYYDENYVAFVNGLGLDGQEIAGLQKMLETVDVHYRKEMLERETVGPEIVGQKIPPRRQRGSTHSQEVRRSGTPEAFKDNKMMLDEEGKPVHGMDLGIMRPEDVKALYETGREDWDEIFEELPDGTFRPLNFEEQLDQILDRNERAMAKYGWDRNEQRESFQNINMKELFDHMKLVDAEREAEYKLDTRPESEKGKFIKYYDMIDEQYYLDHQVAKLEERFMNPASKNPDGTPTDEKTAKDAFEKWWYQEVSFEQRKLAYEGLFEKRSQSPRMSRLNSLMEIIGVGTEKKGLATWMAMSYQMIDAQNNSYVNAEFMQKLAGFWTNQGVDFRLENMLKEYRENISVTIGEGRKAGLRREIRDGKEGKGDVVSINVFDTLNFMQEYVPDASTDAGRKLRDKLNIPMDWKGKWGTFIYKYSAADTRGKARRGAWDHFLETKKGVNLDINVFSESEQTEVSNKYQLMFDLSFNYAVAHKQLYQMLGNASFKEGQFELPAACAEMHLKLDTVLYSKLFVPRYSWLNVAFKEGWALFDPGVRDYITMAPQDYASHFTEYDANNPSVIETDNGSPTIIKTFILGEKDRAVTDADKRVAQELKDIFDKALWHHGSGKNREEALGFIMEWGSDTPGDKNKSAFRNSSGVVSKILSESKLSSDALSAINYEEYFKIAKDPNIERRIRAAEGKPAEQWRIFAETFGEHSYNHSTPSAKRSGDHPVKYGVEAFNKYVETFMAWIGDPYNPEKFDALMDVPTAVNAAVVPGLAEKNLEFLMLMNERMGNKYLGGKSMRRIKRDPKTGATKFDTSKGLTGKGDSEWPSYEDEPISNDKAPWNPLQNKSLPESVGIGIPLDKQVMFDLIRGQRAKGRLPDKLYSDFYKKINRSTLWEPNMGIPLNVYRWVTLEPIFEAIAPMLGITAHELRHILSESTEKTAGNFFKYLNS